MGSIWQDIRYATRMLTKNKGFAATILLILALCIGANTAIFSMLYALVLKPLPFRGWDRIVEIVNASTKNQIKLPGSVAQYLDFRDHVDAFTHLAYWEREEFTLGGKGDPVRSLGLQTTAEIFDLLAVSPVHGRFFTPVNNRPGNNRIVVLTQSFWKTHFNNDLGVLGQSIKINGDSYEIVGIAPYSLEALDTRVQFIIPLALGPESANPLNRYFLKPGSNLYGRLRPNETTGSASSKISAIEKQFQAGLPPRLQEVFSSSGSIMQVCSLQSRHADDVKSRLYLLQGGVLLVLLVGCVNVANLLLARSDSRYGELAIRMALGAQRKTIVRQLLVECILLTWLGAALGIVFAGGLLGIVNHFTAHFLPGKPLFEVDKFTLGFTLLIACPAALFIGMFPIMQVAGGNLIAWMHRHTRYVSGGPKTLTICSMLVIAQISITLVLLIGAGLLIRSFANALEVDSGLNAKQLISARIALTPGYAHDNLDRQFQSQLLNALHGIPGFISATMANAAPFTNARPFYLSFSLCGHTMRPGEPPLSAMFLGVDPSYLETMQIPLIEGRWFNDGDMNSGHPVRVVNQDFARRYFAGRSALGRRFFAGQDSRLEDGPEIIGVVGNTRDLRWEEEWGSSLGYVYSPLQSFQVACVFIRSTRPAAEAIALLRQAVKRIDPELPVFEAAPMEDLVRVSHDDRRAITLLLGSFAGLALLLSAVGIYGLLAYDVSQRTQEIGIRNAVGATRKQIMVLILRRGLWKAGIGLVIGIIGALYLNDFIASLLFNVKPTDPLAYGAVSLLLMLVALIASYLPARRAACVDPSIALRNE
jgi:putative ABC transport system permease protein